MTAAIAVKGYEHTAVEGWLPEVLTLRDRTQADSSDSASSPTGSYLTKVPLLASLNRAGRRARSSAE